MMSVNYPTSLLTSRLQVVINDIDAGASSGWLRLLDIGGNVLSSLQLAKPMGIAANGVLTFLGLSLIDPAASASGTATGARVEDSSGNIIISGLTVGGGPAYDIAMSPTNNIVAGQTIAITQATITGN
jgi:hypothetical protein